MFKSFLWCNNKFFYVHVWCVFSLSILDQSVTDITLFEVWLIPQEYSFFLIFFLIFTFHHIFVITASAFTLKLYFCGIMQIYLFFPVRQFFWVWFSKYFSVSLIVFLSVRSYGQFVLVLRENKQVKLNYAYLFIRAKTYGYLYQSILLKHQAKYIFFGIKSIPLW